MALFASLPHPAALDRPPRKRFRGSILGDSRDYSEHVTIDSDTLRDNARWIRDDLDPIIAQKGPSSLCADHVVILVKFLDSLVKARITIEQLRWSRIHHAVQMIAARATRWPRALIEEADKITEHWTIRYGALNDIHGTLYEEGGRLHGVCTPEEVDKEVLEFRWLRAPDTKTTTGYALRRGHLGATPGDWWINTMFAYHAGAIESGDPTGRIIYDKDGAYGIILTGSDELNDSDPHEFSYPTRPDDPGRYRLTSAARDSREPVRVFRSHTLRNWWAPKVGIRYDGLYRVIGWKIRGSGMSQYDVTLSRLQDQTPLDQVLRRPLAEEVDDYHEFKRLRQVARQSRNTFHRARPVGTPLQGKSRQDSALLLDAFEDLAVDRTRLPVTTLDTKVGSFFTLPTSLKTAR